MTVYLKMRARPVMALYLGVQPGTSKVYSDRTAPGGWEEVELTPRGDGSFLARFVYADKALSIQPDGTFETRPVGSDGPYETLYATTQPDGVSLLYRVVDGCAVGVLSVEEA